MLYILYPLNFCLPNFLQKQVNDSVSILNHLIYTDLTLKRHYDHRIHWF